MSFSGAAEPPLEPISGAAESPLESGSGAGNSPLEPANGAGTSAGEPFDPQGVTWIKVSSRLAVVRRVRMACLMSVLVVALLVVGLGLGHPVIIWFAVLPVAAGAWWWVLVGRQVPAWGYAERDEDLLIRHGLMWRSLVVVPYGRLQYVDVTAGPVERLFGIAGVQLHTASAGTDAHIPGLTPQEAARLRERLASRGEARLAGL